MPPSVLYTLLRDEQLDLKLLASLRLIMSGGDPVQPWAMRAIDEKLPGVALQQGYGLTEGGSMVTILDPEDTLAHPDSVGRPFPLTEVRTMLASGEQASPGEVGEVWVRSPAISGVYWDRPEQSRQTFVDGWCRTGDLGRITPDGFLVITGRDKDMIRSGGENIYPAEVEAVLAEHPAVALVAVVGVPDAKYLEVGCAVVRARETGASADELAARLRAYARDHLAGYKCPRHYVFVDELPINTTGKIEKRVLRERYADIGARIEEVTR
jgi:fatty-acyl-CoA synthase